MKVHKWRIKRRYYDLLLAGAKQLEVRVGYGAIKKVRPGDKIVFSDYSTKQFTVRRITMYETFKDMSNHEDAEKIIPGMSQNKMLATLHDIYPPDKELLGVYVFELEAPYTMIHLSNFEGSSQFKRMANELYMLTDWICADYPSHRTHYFNKYLGGLSKGTREIIGYYVGEKPVGVIILKKDEWESKICTLYVKDSYRGKGVASRLIREGIPFLGTAHPVITIADYKVPQFEGLIDKFGWKHTETLPKGFYNDKSEEYVYNT